MRVKHIVGGFAVFTALLSAERVVCLFACLLGFEIWVEIWKFGLERC